MSKRLTAVDLFSGAGGISLGLEATGFDVLFANDNNDWAAASHIRNLPNSQFSRANVRRLTGGQIMKSVGLRPEELDLLVGGPPCQGFSIIGSRIVHDERNDLFLEFFRIGRQLRPKCMVIENVPGIATLARGAILREIIAAFHEAKYTVAFAELLAAQYGVPQMRWRMVLVGSREDLKIPRGMGFPKPTHGRRGIGELVPNCTISDADLKAVLTTREAIGDMPPVSAGSEHGVY